MVNILRGPRRRILISLLLALLLVSALPLPVMAADYSFTVDKNIVNVHILADGSIDIEYWLTFTVDAGARPIDVVDIGMPKGSFNRGDVIASLDGTPITNIEKSPYVDYGFAVNLGSNKIPAGQSGTLYVKANCREMVYPDSSDEAYASMVFRPTWFSQQLSHGSTELTVSIFFPPGVSPDDTRYHQIAYDEARMEGETPVMVWHRPEARPHGQYDYGVSFPKSFVSSIIQPPKTVAPSAGSSSGGATGSSGGSGDSSLWFLLIVAVVAGGIGWAAKRHERKQKMKYLPPSIQVEGVKIKKGLTPVEAAILAEKPLPRVVAMILFSCVKKGLVRVKDAAPPITLELLVPRDAVSRDTPLTAHQVFFNDDGSFFEYEVSGDVDSRQHKVKPYEADFLKAIDKTGHLDREALQTMVTRLIVSITKKMKGYAAEATLAYHREMLWRAWRQVKSAQTPEDMTENLEWTMLDPEYERKMSQYAGHWAHGSFWWYRGMVPYHSAPMPTAAAGATGSGQLAGSEFAHGLVSGIERAATGILPDAQGFTEGVTGQIDPGVNAGGGWGGGGGGGCACACACAGCACACAGGGR
jgi:hypothetical protein